jgi:hypothetical protein
MGDNIWGISNLTHYPKTITIHGIPDCIYYVMIVILVTVKETTDNKLC